MILTGTFDLRSRDPWTQNLYARRFLHPLNLPHSWGTRQHPLLEHVSDPRCTDPEWEGPYMEWARMLLKHQGFFLCQVYYKTDAALHERARIFHRLIMDMRENAAHGKPLCDPVDILVTRRGLVLRDGGHRIAVAWSMGLPCPCSYEFDAETEADYAAAMDFGKGRCYQRCLHPALATVPTWRWDETREKVIIEDLGPGASFVVDVGANYGLVSWAMAQAGHRVLAVDAVPVPDVFWPGFPRVKSIMDVTWPSEGRRVLLLLAVMHHMSDAERERCVELANTADAVYVEPPVPANCGVYRDLEPWLSRITIGPRRHLYTTTDQAVRPVYGWRRP